MAQHPLVSLGMSGMPTTLPISPCISVDNGANPYLWLPPVLAGLYVILFAFGLTAILLSNRASFTLAIRRLVLWPFLVASGLAVLGIAWSLELSSTFDGSGCVWTVQSAPFDYGSISLVTALLILGTMLLSVAYLVLDVILVIRIWRSKRAIG